MNDEKMIWFFECRCGRRFIAHVPVQATCTRHERPVTIPSERIPYAEAMRRMHGGKSKPKKSKPKSEPESIQIQLTLGF
jgi:hypothetical protein